MYNKEAKKRTQALYAKLAFELDLLQSKKEIIDGIAEAIRNGQFDEEWEKVLVSLERPRL